MCLRLAALRSLMVEPPFREYGNFRLDPLTDGPVKACRVLADCRHVRGHSIRNPPSDLSLVSCWKGGTDGEIRN